MKTVNIKGKDYVMINERIKFFRESEQYKDWSLESDIISHEKGRILIKATIKNQDGKIISTGLAQEKEEDGFINKTSYVENCETSAWGRALGNLSIGIDASIASAEEVQNAMNNPKSRPYWWGDAVKYLKEGGDIETIIEKKGINPEQQKELLKDAS